MTEENPNVSYEIRVSAGKAGTDPEAPDWEVAELENGVLKDKGGHTVEFSIITNAGNRPRESMATMIQQDLGQIGMKVSVVTLDFPSLIDRITMIHGVEVSRSATPVRGPHDR